MKPTPPSPAPIAEKVRQFGSRLLPHDNRRTTCPPAPLACGAGPVIIVPSIMRSGTHLLLDALFNNFPALRRVPLFLDFDAYERAGLPVGPLDSLQGIIIKTHYPQIKLAGPYAAALAKLASRAVVLTPKRPSAAVRRSLAKWDMRYTEDEFQALEGGFNTFWAPWNPLAIEFSTLLNAGGMQNAINLVAARTGLARRRGHPVMPAQHRLGIYFDKGLTRMLGGSAPRVNTTVGYRVAPVKPA